jgi:hypothetical protein
MSTVDLAYLMPYLSGSRVADVIGDPKLIVGRAEVVANRVSYPLCAVPTERVHSSYERRLAVPAIGSRAATVEPTTNRARATSSAYAATGWQPADTVLLNGPQGRATRRRWRRTEPPSGR